MSFSLTETAVAMIESAGYTGYALGLIVDSAGIPIPSEVLIALASISSFQGEFNIAAVIIIGTLAQTFGGYLAYEIGKHGGVPLIHRYGKYVLISQKDLAFTHRQFQKHGELLACVGRCVPVIRGYIGFVAGIAEMSLRKFLLASLLGSFVWTVVWVLIGKLVSHDVEAIDRAVKPFSYVILGLIIAGFAGLLYHRWRHNAKASNKKGQD